MARKLLLLLASATAIAVPNAMALIIFDTATSVDNSLDVIDPANAATFPTGSASGVPWQYVIRYDTNNATAVYLGNGFLLTPRHVVVANSNLIIQGTSYNRDTSFAPVLIALPGSPSDQFIDLQVQKIIGDPGLPALPIAAASTADLNTASVIIGWGQGKGSVITEQGWTWGGDTTRAFRWGTNTTTSSATSLTYAVGGSTMNYLGLSTLFQSTDGTTGATGTLGDSGSALFQSPGGIWTLCGLTVTVTTSGTSLYDTNPLKPGDQNPDGTFYVRLREYSWVLRFDYWKTKYGIAQATADNDDSDKDGVPLLLEYALGLHPAQPSVAGLPQASEESSNLVLTFQRLASATDIKVEVETSSTLAPGDWTVQPATFTVLDGTTVFQKVKATVPVGASSCRFARLKVTRL